MHNEMKEIMMGEEPHKPTKRIGGKIYHLHKEEIMSKAGAEGLAEHMRNRGYLVRIFKESGGHNEWLIYYRKK